MSYYHLTARARFGLKPLEKVEHARWLWRALRKMFPRALAVCLMPNHVHLVTSEVGGNLPKVLAAMAGRFPAIGARIWECAAPPAPIADSRHLLRTVRYLALNPCRDGLCSDPLAWPWSSHRDHLGARWDPWTPASRLAHAVGWSEARVLRELHAYVSADPSTCVSGTARPRSAIETPEFATSSLLDIAYAVAAATDLAPAALRSTGPARNLFVRLARSQGWRSTQTLARAAAVNPRTVLRIAAGPIPRAALLCLGDPRLTEWHRRVYPPTEVFARMS